MNIIKNLAFRSMISIFVSYSISQQFPVYEDFILIFGTVAMFTLLSYLSKKF